MPKNKKLEELEQQNGELVADLQRMRADFENYRKMVEQEKLTARENGQTAAVLKLLPVVDTIERAILHIPTDIAEHPWVKGVGGLIKQLDGALASMNLRRIEAKPGTQFDPELHQAIKFDEDAEGENEVIAKELQAGYLLNGRPVRHAMVEVTRK
mgnify:CR=1 FL=1